MDLAAKFASAKTKEDPLHMKPASFYLIPFSASSVTKLSSLVMKFVNIGINLYTFGVTLAPNNAKFNIRPLSLHGKMEIDLINLKL